VRLGDSIATQQRCNLGMSLFGKTGIMSDQACWKPDHQANSSPGGWKPEVRKHAAGVARPRLRYQLSIINFPLPLTGEAAVSDFALAKANLLASG
jgi:hypothetical protein